MNWDWKPDLYRIFIDRTAGDNTWSGFLWHTAERRGMLQQFASSRTGNIPAARSDLESLYERASEDDRTVGEYRTLLKQAVNVVENFLTALSKIEPRDGFPGGHPSVSQMASQVVELQKGLIEGGLEPEEVEEMVLEKQSRQRKIAHHRTHPIADGPILDKGLDGPLFAVKANYPDKAPMYILRGATRERALNFTEEDAVTVFSQEDRDKMQWIGNNFGPKELHALYQIIPETAIAR